MRPETAPTPGPARVERRATLRLHRAFFTLLAALPRPLAAAARAAVFNTRFTKGTPWPYDTCPFERAKRAALVGAVPDDSRVIVEVGCADGHNLTALAAHARHARIVGADLSEQACELARVRTAHDPRITIARSDLASLPVTLPWLTGTVDAIVLAEVLYYLGGTRGTAEALEPITSLLSPTGRLVLVHGSPDAQALHRRAAGHTGLAVLSDHTEVADGREFRVTVLGAQPLPADVPH